MPPILFLIAGLQAATEQKPEYAPARRLVDVLLAAFGFSVLIFSGVQVVTHWQDIDKCNAALQFALPVWLTIGALPYVYLLGVYAGYENLFMRLAYKASSSRSDRLKQKSAALLEFKLRAHDLGKFGGHWQFKLAEQSSVSGGRRVIRDFRRAEDQKRREAAETAERLQRFAGVDGEDEDGRRLDQREFEESRRALRWIHTCHMGWYRRNDRYRKDLLQLLGNDFSSQGLSGDAGVVMHVARNGQSWYGWRRTVTGWCFGIGAAGPPPDEWLYDGPEPPKGMPGTTSSWAERPFDDSRARHW